MAQSGFRMGRLDHVHIRVPDRAEAARWYSEHLGFEPVAAYDFWATGFEGGPLQISADGGRTTLALFEASDGHPMVPQQTGVAFSVDADSFISFARSLPCGIDNSRGEPLVVDVSLLNEELVFDDLGIDMALLTESPRKPRRSARPASKVDDHDS